MRASLSFFVLAALGGSLAVSAAEAPASARLGAIQRLLDSANAQLDSLRLEVAHPRPAMEGSSTETSPKSPAFSGEDAEIWREVVAEKRRRRQLEEAFTYTRSSLGFTFNPNLIMGMNATQWVGGWGAKVDGRFALNENRRTWGANLSLLRAIHEFYLSDEAVYTRLYAFVGGGYYWKREPASNGWFDTPDESVRLQIGAGTELGAREMYGTRFTPEIGVQGSRFLARYQDSDDWTHGRPESDYSLFPYFSLHINFYFL